MTLEYDDWWQEHMRHYSAHVARARAQRIEEAILGTGVLKMRWGNETCRCGQTVTVATLDAFRKTKDGVWRHKNPDDCIAALEGALVRHKNDFNRQASQINDLYRRVVKLETRRWWRR